MKIVKLTISNFLKLKDVEMNPSHTNVIAGKNKQGKTSVLKAIKAAFTGDADASSIRVGESKAEITVELDDLTVRRTLTEKGNYLDITNKDGFKVPAPQKYLDGILGTFSFNPIEFFEMKPVDRKKYLLRAIDMRVTPQLLDEMTGYKGFETMGLDFGKHALEVVADAYKTFYERRTALNADVSKKQKTISELSAQLPDGFDPNAVSEEQIGKLRAAIQTDKMERQKADANAQRVLDLQKREASIKAQIESLQGELKGVETEIVDALALKFDFSDDVAMKAAEESLAGLEAKRGLVFTHQKIEDTRKELSVSMAEQEKVDGIVKSLSKEVPQKLVETADLPIKGITITDDDVLVNGISLDNLSTSEQLRFGLDVVRHLNQKFRVICIDGIEALDRESFEFFLNEIEADDYQYFVSRVDGDAAAKNQIVIEDGEIKKVSKTINKS